ncbi:MAG TPA: alpha/beta hydrolase [Anaerolineae bacterium]|nr:alpha/beta hydrolase [Anaerolineae bacterium]HQI87110.1 alpha/beta hydrolase [Anaerolineae bacterium]
MQPRSSNSLWLWPGEPPCSSPEDDAQRPWLERYPADTPDVRGAVLVCPGGGYNHRAAHEAEPIARRFNACGFHAFVVQYRVSPHRHPAPLLDASRALRLIRAHTDEWRVDPARIAVCGFSAGGHLAASLGVHYGMDVLNTGDDLDAISARPDALILCYPVITSGEFAHRGCFETLLGPDATPELLRLMSLERQVTPETPPTFLWHTAEDGGVPVENSLLFAAALHKHNVPFELHIYPYGRHGLGLASEDAHVATWAALCCAWLRGTFGQRFV